MLYLVNKDHKIDYKTESANIYEMFFFVSIIDILTQRERQERVHEIFLFFLLSIYIMHIVNFDFIISRVNFCVCLNFFI